MTEPSPPAIRAAEAVEAECIDAGLKGECLMSTMVEIIERETGVGEATRVITALMEHAERIQDEGPPGEGWQSDSLCKALSDGRNFIEKNQTPL